jgi:hypothetical protein
VAESGEEKCSLQRWTVPWQRFHILLGEFRKAAEWGYIKRTERESAEGSLKVYKPQSRYGHVSANHADQSGRLRRT